MTGTIYAFCDPRTLEVRYIGMTRRSPAERLRRRLYEARRRGCKTHLANWLRTVQDRPLLIVLESAVPVGDLGAREREWIAAGRRWGWRLTNGSDGGDGNPGFKHSADTRRKIGAAVRGERQGHAKLTRQEVETILSQRGTGRTQADVAEQFGVDRAHVGNIWRGVCWAHLQEA